MAKIIDLDRYKKKQLSDLCLNAWNRRFRENFDEFTTLKHLSDKTVLYLASPGDKSTNAFYELIDCMQGQLRKKKNQSINKQDELEMMDIHLLLADRVRFELMARLEWVSEYPDEQLPIIDLVQEFRKNIYKSFHRPPKLSDHHPDYPRFETLIDREKEVFIKKLFVNALIVFNNKLNNNG